MRKTSALILCVTVLAAPAFGQEAEQLAFKGKVVDEQSQPIAGAWVEAYELRAEAPRGYRVSCVGKAVTEADGAFSFARPAERAPSGRAIGMILAGKDGLASVPAGTYMVDKYELEAKDASGTVWHICEAGADAEKPFTVEEGKESALGVGEPFVAKVTVQAGEGGYMIEQALKTQRGDYVQLRRAGQRPPPPKIRITNADGTYDKTFPMAYG